MAVMGKPIDGNNSFGSIAMAPKKHSPNEKINEREKEKLINRLTGFKPKSIYSDKDPNKMGKDEFLKLLTHQLKNQDPMNPMEQGKMAGELAQFSQLEQLSNINTKFDDFNKNKNMETQFYGASFLGKEVVTSGQTMNYLGDGKRADMMFKLDQEADKVLARVFDSQNNIIGEVWKENIGRGNQTFTWDGETLDGGSAKAGEYKIQIYAWDKNADPIKVETKVKGIVDSIYFENGETILMVDGKKVFLRDVDSFHIPGNVSSSAPDKDATLALNNKAYRENLPIDSKRNDDLELNNKRNNQRFVSDEAPTTGATSVYDIE